MKTNEVLYYCFGFGIVINSWVWTVWLSPLQLSSLMLTFGQWEPHWRVPSPLHRSHGCLWQHPRYLVWQDSPGSSYVFSNPYQEWPTSPRSLPSFWWKGDLQLQAEHLEDSRADLGLLCSFGGEQAVWPGLNDFQKSGERLWVGKGWPGTI